MCSIDPDSNKEVTVDSISHQSQLFNVESTSISSSWQVWFCCSLLDRVGPIKFQQLLEHGISPQVLLNSTSEQLSGLGLSKKARQQLLDYQQGCGVVFDKVQHAKMWLEASPLHHIIPLDHASYPERLRHIADPPPVLFVYGHLKALNLPQVAIVGSRHAARASLRHAGSFAAELCRLGFAVTSGLALGVDAFAHAGAVDVRGVTLAVLGTGVDNIYPKRHFSLAQDIVENGGAVISENTLGGEALAHMFPRRNRIISGMSLGVLVVEASIKSGSLITAKHALEQGREVFALPCGIDNVKGTGNLQLLKQGATLTVTVEDIVAELAPMLDFELAKHGESEYSHRVDGPSNNDHPTNVSGLAAQLLALVSDEGLTLEQLSSALHQPSNSLAVVVTELELEGLVEVTGEWVRRG